ncbi:hypothetical protein F0Q45_05835 [Mycobacterium simiae]|uniref:Serine aminopeptidase S33 domain-containing protein n=1 Tax=Mycobacterium simiae TaxID=1784 RepID=A0A5B1BSZ8_MYCSI|nr:alpha/beta fold hydrolase [Mycobacterium simiae]KAA1251171.1 hypothetical protein F0Q45_05835 [Mycobacterium simiae]
MATYTRSTVWTGEEHPRHRVQATTLTVADGGRFRVTRVGDGHGVPVVMVPGMFDNRRLYLWADGGGLAVMLADNGFDAWIVERRGTGGITAAAGTRAGWEQLVYVDMPAVQELVAAANDRPAFWIGHSFGGVALARAVAETMQQTQLAGLVLFNAAIDIPLLANPIVAATVRGRIWGGSFPARRLRLGPENEPVAALQDAICWGRAERSWGELSESLSMVDLPVLAFTAPRDVIAPPSRCDRLANLFASTDRRVQSAGRRQGFGRNHTHESTLLHPAAAADVFPFLQDWLTTRTGEFPSVNTDTLDSTRRHRLDYTVEFDAPAVRVFEVLSRKWSTLWPVRQRRVRDGLDRCEPDGLRSVRAQRVLGLWPIQEEIVGYRPCRLIEYRVVRGPVRNHIGRIELVDRPDGGTRLHYRIDFDTPPWLPGYLVAAAIDRTWRRWSLLRLHRAVAHNTQLRGTGMGK